MYRFDMELPEGIVWTTHISGKGKEYRIGRLPDAGSKGEDRTAKDATGGKFSRAPFGIDVNWPVANTTSWQGTQSDVQTIAGITQYALYQTTNPLYPYILWFTNTEHYDYFFYDQTGDSYQVDTWRDGSHWVQYNSAKPTILFIKGA
ncbi:hypothetical protein MVEN_00136700 [Mycena venus]|uniref:Uncharacterized protein n=1 Tax=Mycena venus TaxID=2733690 RepID=A0A8H7CDD9_9AGAR|nr:hypothetical protein MVEN_02375300 [Mycena venus]KAF7368176.1 hypothetical protein MVEN_00136700 [Mycena venus]